MNELLIFAGSHPLKTFSNTLNWASDSSRLLKTSCLFEEFIIRLTEGLSLCSQGNLYRWFTVGIERQAERPYHRGVSNFRLSSAPVTQMQQTVFLYC